MRELILTGRLVSDAEVKTTMNGHTYLTMRVANQEGGSDQTYYFDVETYDPVYINSFKPYLTKGSAVDIIGELRAKAYIKKDGTPENDLRVVARIIKFHRLGTKKESEDEVQVVDGAAVTQDVVLQQEQDDLPF